jgi:hypothetical protein
MADAGRHKLARECAIFTRHITGAAAPDYVVTCYIAAHERGSVQPPRGVDALDALLLRVATAAPPLTPVADIYARFSRKGGALRRKLVLLAAILESAGPTQLAFEPPPRSGGRRVLAALAARGALFALQAAAALVLLGPPHLILRLSGRTQARGAAAAPAQP